MRSDMDTNVCYTLRLNTNKTVFLTDALKNNKNIDHTHRSSYAHKTCQYLYDCPYHNKCASYIGNVPVETATDVYLDTGWSAMVLKDRDPS